jgi:hypothetical protein
MQRSEAATVVFQMRSGDHWLKIQYRNGRKLISTRKKEHIPIFGPHGKAKASG